MTDLKPSSDQFLQHPHPDDEIDLKELFMVLWRGKWFILSLTGFVAVLSVVFALSQPNVYTASAVLAPADRGDGSLSGFMKQYSGLASIAGVALPGGEEGSRAQLGIQLMKSRAFIGDFAERRDILPDLLAVEAWDASSRQMIYDPEIYEAASKTWVRNGIPIEAVKPSVQEIHKAFSGALGVFEDKKTGFVTISIDHQSPIAAAQWVSWLVSDVNAAVKAQVVLEAERSIEYLRQQVAKTSLADLQTMFFELIQSQTEIMMLAEVRPEYVFKTIDPALVPEEKSKPNRAQICVLGTLFGGILAVVIVLIRHYIFSTVRSDA